MMPFDLSGINPAELPDQPTATDSDLLNSLPDQPEVSIRQAPSEEHVFKAKEIWDSMVEWTKEDPKAVAAKAQNAMALSDMLKISPSEAYDNHDEIAKNFGLDDKGPSGLELAGYGLLYPMATAIMSNPLAAGLGLAAYQTLAEAESWAISRAQKKPYQVFRNRGLRDLLPEETNELTSDMVEMFDILGKGAAVAGASKLPKPIWEKATKQIVTEYNLPKDVYVPAQAVKSIFQTGEHISPAELGLVTSLGLNAVGYKDALKTGLWIRVPGEKIVNITDRPYWGKLKEYIGIKPYQESIITKLGKAEKIGSGLLIEGTKRKSAAEIAGEGPSLKGAEDQPAAPATRDLNLKYGEDPDAGLGQVTRDNFQQKLKDAFGSTDEEAEAAQAIVDARAEAWSAKDGRPAEEYYPTYLEDIVKGGKPGSGETGIEEIKGATSGRKGSIEFFDNGRAIIRGLKNPDVSTGMHEIGHVFRREMAETEPELLSGIESEFKVTDGNWSRKAEEDFADSFLKYLKDGEAPTENLKTAFERFRDWLSAIWEKIRNAVLDKDINPKVKSFFDEMLGGEKKAREMTATEPNLLEGTKASSGEPAVPGGAQQEDLAGQEQITAPMSESDNLRDDIQEFLDETNVPHEDRFGAIDENAVKAYEEMYQDEPLEVAAQNEAKDLEVLYQAQRRLNRTTKVEMRRQIMADVREIRARLKARAALKAKADKMIEKLKKIKTDELPRHQKDNIDALLDGFGYQGLSKKKRLSLEETREYLRTHPDQELPDYVLKDLERLDKKNIRDIPYRDLEGLYMAVMHEIKLAQMEKRIRVREKDVELAKAVSFAIAEMKPPTVLEDSLIDGTEKGVGKKGPGRLVKKLLWEDSLHYDLLVEKIAGVNSTIHDVLYTQVKEGITKQLVYRQKAFDKFKQDMQDLGFFEKHHIDDFGAWLKEPVTVGRITLTRDQRMSLYRHFMNKDNRTAIVKGGFGFRSGKDPNKVFHVTKDELYKLIDTIDPAERELAEIPVENFSNDNYDALNKVFEKKNGYDLPRVEGTYWPKDVMSITRSDFGAEEEDALETLKGQWVRPGVSKGMLNKRVGSVKPVYLKGLTETINDMVMKAGAYVGLEIPLSNASRLLYNKTFRYELEQRYGRDIWKALEQGLRDIAGEFKTYNTVEQFILQYKNALVSSIFGLNPFVMAKQLLAYPLYLPYVDSEYMKRGLLDYIFKHDEVVQALKNISPEYRERLEGGYSRDVADIFKSDVTRRFTGKDTSIPEKLTAGIRLFDRLAVTPGMWGAYLQALDELKVGHLSPKVAEALNLSDQELMLGTSESNTELAARYAEWATQRTQPMFGPEHRSALSRGNTLAKILTMFTEASNAMFNMIARTIMAYQRNPTEEKLKQIAWSLFAVFCLNTLGNTSVDALRDRIYNRDKKSWPQRIADDWSGVFYFIRDLVPSITSHLERGPYGGYDPNNPLSKISDTFVHTAVYGAMALHEWYVGRTNKAEKYLLKFMDSAAEAVLMYYGIPYGTPKKMITTAYEATK